MTKNLPQSLDDKISNHLKVIKNIDQYQDYFKDFLVSDSKVDVLKVKEMCSKLMVMIEN